MPFDPKAPSPRERLILPLDLSSLEEARNIVAELGDAVDFFKLGYQFLYANGFDFIDELKAANKQVFVDLKLLDIDNTVYEGVKSLVSRNATFLTLHAYPHAMRAAVAAKAQSSVHLLGVTVLTSLNEEGLEEAGYRDRNVGDLVLERARQAQESGIDGIVCSPVEASIIRTVLGPELTLVTPGIRPLDSASDDQKRVMTASLAIENGSDYLVVGRPILNAPDRRAAANAIVDEIKTALEKRQPAT